MDQDHDRQCKTGRPQHLACAIAALPATAFGTWGTSFLIRSHHFSLQQAGLLTGLVGICGQAIGTVFSGWLIDRLSPQTPAWQVRVPLLGLLLAMPMGVLYFLWPVGILFSAGSFQVPTVFVFGVLFSFFSAWWIAPTYAAISNLIASERRGLATAVFSLAFSAVGMGLGPLVVGAISDGLAPIAGTESLRYAMALTIASSLLAVWAMALAVRPYVRNVGSST